MKQCPKCGRYMTSYLKNLFGGVSIIYNCSCGYSTKNSSSGIHCNNRTYSTGKFTMSSKSKEN